MKTMSRRQAKTPVGHMTGHMTKRGAELEATPKTPSSFEVSSAGKSSAGDPHDDRVLHPKSKRPLLWNSITILPTSSNTGISEDALENVSSPQHQRSNTTAEPKAVAALSPICLNAIPIGFYQQRAQKDCTKALPLPPRIEDHAGMGRKNKPLRLRVNRKQGSDDESLDGSCSASSPESPPISGGRVYLWSNAAFSQGSPALSEGAEKSSSCSVEKLADRQEDNIINIEVSQKNSRKTQNGEIRVGWEMPGILVEASQVKSSPNNLGAKIQGMKVNGEARKTLFEDCNAEQASAVFPTVCHSLTTKKEEGGQAKIGLDEIDREIERLTEKLTELRIQKRKREEEMKRQGHETSKKEDVAAVQGKQGVSSNGSAMGRGVDASAGAFPSIHTPRRSLKCREDSPRVSVSKRMQPSAGGTPSKMSELRRSVSCVSSRRRGESNTRRSNAEMECARRRLSLSGAMLDMEQQQHHEHPQQRLQVKKPSRIVSALMTNSSSSKGGGGGGATGTPSSRVVSSRYGRSSTPDACACPSSVANSYSFIKKRDRPSLSASSSPLPLRQQSISANSPLKKVATTPRSGYPSRLGFSTPISKEYRINHSLSFTPTKMQQEQQQHVSSTTCSSVVAVPSSSKGTHVNRGLLYSSPPCKSRLDSPKSTAALYKCLESLLEDSKHFFKRMSPAHHAVKSNNALVSHIHHHQGSTKVTDQPASCCNIAPDEPTRSDILPTINTCRQSSISPRDSGCVKRAADRQTRHFFFAKDELLIRPPTL